MCVEFRPLQVKQKEYMYKVAVKKLPGAFFNGRLGVGEYEHLGNLLPLSANSGPQGCAVDPPTHPV